MKAHILAAATVVALWTTPLLAQETEGEIVQEDISLQELENLVDSGDSMDSSADAAEFAEDQVSGEDGGDEPLYEVPEVTAEDGLAVEYSLTELQQLIQSGAAAPIREFQEDLNNPKALFESEADLRRIFDATPEFIYFPTGVDPMIIPWVRERVVAEELFTEAMVARSVRDFEKAKAILREINDQYPNTEHGQKAPGEIANIDRTIEEERLAAIAREQAALEPDGPVLIAEPPAPQRPQLPQWVKDNTTAVMMTETGEPVAMVGAEFLRPGDPVPRYSAVRVKTVAPSAVVYVYENEEFTVDVVGTF